jgi:hypothetical protein
LVGGISPEGIGLTSEASLTKVSSWLSAAAALPESSSAPTTATEATVKGRCRIKPEDMAGFPFC